MNGAGSGMAIMLLGRSLIPREQQRDRFESFAAVHGTTTLRTAVWPTAAGVVRRAVSATSGFDRSEDFSPQYPAMKKVSQRRTRAEPHDRSVREGGTTDRKRRSVEEGWVGRQVRAARFASISREAI